MGVQRMQREIAKPQQWTFLAGLVFVNLVAWKYLKVDWTPEDELFWTSDYARAKYATKQTKGSWFAFQDYSNPLHPDHESWAKKNKPGLAGDHHKSRVLSFF